MLHQRHDIREPFVQGQRVRVGRFVETSVHAIEYRVRRLVGHDVMRQTRVNRAAGNMIAGIVRPRLKVAKQQRDVLRAVKSICLTQSVRAHAQAAHELTIVKLVVGIDLRPPKDWPTQRPLKMLNRIHGNCVNHLLMKPWITFGRGTAILRQQPGLIQVDGIVSDARSIGVRDFEVFAFRSGLEFFPSYFQRDFIDPGSRELGRQTRIHSVSADAAEGRIRHTDLRIAGRLRWRNDFFRRPLNRSPDNQ